MLMIMMKNATLAKFSVSQNIMPLTIGFVTFFLKFILIHF